MPDADLGDEELLALNPAPTPETPPHAEPYSHANRHKPGGGLRPPRRRLR